jgi:chromate reductase
MAQPEAYIGNAGDLFDKHGNLINESTLEFSRKFMLAFSEWVTKITTSKI